MILRSEFVLSEKMFILFANFLPERYNKILYQYIKQKYPHLQLQSPFITVTEKSKLPLGGT